MIMLLVDVNLVMIIALTCESSETAGSSCKSFWVCCYFLCRSWSVNIILDFVVGFGFMFVNTLFTTIDHYRLRNGIFLSE